MKNYIVYKHISPSNKSYIGITCQKNYKHRWNNGKGYVGNDYFTKAINKYGWENFRHLILYENLTEEEAKAKEIELINKFNTTDRSKGYNITFGGESGNGYHHTQESKERISRKLKGVNTWTKTVLKGRRRGKLTDECRNKISQSKMGSIPWNKGVKYEGDRLKSIQNSHSKPVLVYLNSTKEFYKRFESRRECAKYFGCSETTVGDCLSGRAKTFLKKQYIARYE